MGKYINADDWSYDSTITQAKFINISDILSYFTGLYGKNKSVDQMIEKLIQTYSIWGYDEHDH